MIQLICRSNSSTDYQKETQTKTFASLFNNKKNKNHNLQKKCYKGNNDIWFYDTIVGYVGSLCYWYAESWNLLVLASVC